MYSFDYSNHVGTVGGAISAVIPNPSVPGDILRSIENWLREGCSLEL